MKLLITQFYPASWHLIDSLDPNILNTLFPNKLELQQVNYTAILYILIFTS
jgi:hypothetical protein